MTQDSMRAYVARITQANRTQLTVVIYDVIIDEIRYAYELSQEAKEAEASEADKQRLEIKRALKKAQLFLMELVSSLDMHYHLAHELHRLYLFMNRELLSALRTSDMDSLPSVCEMLESLRASFDEVAKQDHSRPLMENTQQIYAGMTYGRDSLNEISIDAAGGGKRGFVV